MRSLLFLVLITTAGSLCAQNSLFDKAVVLDSLYDRILAGENELAPEVFAVLKTLYPGGDDLTDAIVYQDVTADNFYLTPKINYVRSQLLGVQAEVDQTAEELEEQRDSLTIIIVELADAACYANGAETCPFEDDLLNVKLFTGAEYITGLLEAIDPALYPELHRRIAALQQDILRLEVAIDQLQKSEEAELRLNGTAGPGEFLTGAGSVVDQGFAPIIVPSGGGSLQSSVIDGASRWIAERMREELSIAFFDRFEVWLEEKRMHTLFPETVRALGITATTDYSLMLQVLRSAFERDLEELPFNVGDFLRQEIANRDDVLAQELSADKTYARWRVANALWSTSADTDDDARTERLYAQVDSLGGRLFEQNRRLQTTNQEFNYVLMSIAAIHELSQGKHVADLLATLNARSGELFPHGGNIRPALMLMDVLSRSFIRVDPQQGTTWLRRRDLNRLTRDQQLREFYFGLIALELRQQFRRRRANLLAERQELAGGVAYFGDNEIATFAEAEKSLRKMAGNPRITHLERELYLLKREERFLTRVVQAERRFISRMNGEPWIGSLLNQLSLFTERMDGLQRQYAQLRAADQARLGNPQLIQLIRQSIGILTPVLEIALPEQQEKVTTIRQLSEGILDAYTGVLERDYDKVVLNVIPVAGTLLDVDYAATLERKELAPELTEKFTTDHAARKRKLQEVFRYGAFLAAVAQSRNPEDIKQAIRAIALPTGSYSIKRRSFANVSLNTYPGLTGGLEFARSDSQEELAPNFGFTAPVGLAFSWGFRSRINDEKYLNNPRYRRRVDRSPEVHDNRFLNGHAGSLFFPLIDLGAVVLFRLDGSTNALPEDVGFQQVFSPGVVYSHGFPNLPISLLAGAQVSPQLRKFGDEPADAIRFNLGVTVDLPMANFYTRRVERERDQSPKRKSLK